MISLPRIFLWLALAGCTVAAENSTPAPNHPVVWDAMEKTIMARPGDGAAEFVFRATNTSGQAVVITSVKPSCGCTTVELPASPWVLAAGASGELRATVDFSGKDGLLAKSLAVSSKAGLQTLFLRVDIPPADETMRLRNRQFALENRQAVFRGECASCHVMPNLGKTGEALFQTACAICHASSRRAALVPDLLTARDHRDAAWWRTWIGEGREGTLMPAFAEKHGGPLSPQQIESLVEFALAKLPTAPQKN